MACFIERDSRIKSINKTLVGQWLNAVSPTLEGERMQYPDYIKIEVISAWNKEDQVWKAILSSEHIWCQSYFIGESANLFVNMLEMAIRDGVRNKYFFDLAERWKAVYHLLGIQKDIKSHMQWLEDNRNIKFFFWEEIGQMMGMTADMLF